MLASTGVMLLATVVLSSSSEYAMLLVACCLAGTALGCMLPSAPALVAEYFGSVSFGTIMGGMYVATGISSIVSVAFVGAAFDRTGNYSTAFMTFVGLSVLAAAAVMAVRPALGELRNAKKS
jgi:MFS family permease